MATGGDVNFLLEQLLSRVPTRARCLDVGCGDGSVGFALAARGCSVLGIDLALPLPLPHGIRFDISDITVGSVALIKADGLDIALEERFDVVLALGLLHSLGDRHRVEQAIRRIGGWTAPGGLALVSWLVDASPSTAVHIEAYFPPADVVVEQLIAFGFSCVSLTCSQVAHAHGGLHHAHHVIYSSWRYR